MSSAATELDALALFDADGELDRIDGELRSCTSRIDFLPLSRAISGEEQDGSSTGVLGEDASSDEEADAPAIGSAGTRRSRITGRASSISDGAV